MRCHHGMRPQDTLVLLKLVSMASDEKPWKQIDLAQTTGLSRAEISDSLNRNRLAGLVDAEKRRPMRRALADFLLHGLRYVFPVEAGRVLRGMPTAHCAPPLSHVVISDEKYVWPDEAGELRGAAVPHRALRRPSGCEAL